MSSQMTLGVKIAITFPTYLYLFSLAIKNYSTGRLRRELAKYPEITNLTKKVRVDFFRDLYLESFLLTVGNFLIFVFELGQLEMGFIISLVAIILSFGGLYAAESDTARTTVSFILGLILFSEWLYFVTFEISTYIALIPMIFFLLLIVATYMSQRKQGVANL